MFHSLASENLITCILTPMNVYLKGFCKTTVTTKPIASYMICHGLLQPPAHGFQKPVTRQWVKRKFRENSTWYWRT